MQNSENHTHVSARLIGSGLVLSSELRSRIDHLISLASARTEASHPENDRESKSGVGGKMGSEVEILKNATHPAKFGESGPFRKHRLRPTPARTAFLAQAKTASIAPVNHQASKTKQIVENSGVKKISEILEIFASNSGTSKRPEIESQVDEDMAGKQVHVHTHIHKHASVSECNSSRLGSIENPTTANSDGRGGASRVVQEAARDKQAIPQTSNLEGLSGSIRTTHKSLYRSHQQCTRAKEWSRLGWEQGWFNRIPS